MTYGFIPIQRITDWIQYRVVNQSKKQGTDLVEEIVQQVVAKPRKAQVLQVYSKRHWRTRILPSYRAQLATQRLEYLAQNKPLPHSNIRLKIRVTQEQWALETPEFQEAVRLETEGMYEASVKAYDEAFRNIPKNGKEYDWLVLSFLSSRE